MINAVITNKGNTLITEFPKDYLKIYEELCSIGIRKALERIRLTDNEEDDIRVKLWSDSDFGNHLLRLFSETNTLADVNTACFVIEKADESIKEELEQNLLNDQYSSNIELICDIKDMTEQLGQTEAENSYADWNIGDTCVMIVSIPKRYTQEFEVKGFDGKYYTLKHGDSVHRAVPSRMFRTKEEALDALDTGKYHSKKHHHKNIITDNERTEEQSMNRFEAERRFVQRMKDNYPPGTRIMLLSMGDDPRPIEDNTKGTVMTVDDIGTLHCAFDNGRSLGIVPGEDSFRRLTDEELAEEQQEDFDEDNAPIMGM